MSAVRHTTRRALAASLVLLAAGASGVPAASASGTGTGGPVGGDELARSGVIVNLVRGVPAPPEPPDASWLVADLDTGAVVAARAPHARHLPASTLKALTALVLVPRLDAHTPVVATAADVRADGTRVGMVPGTAYTVRTLFQGLLMTSGNDAAYALARVAGGLPSTVAAMNAEAARLGALDTRAVDPSGLDARGQTSSAYDLALIGRAAMQVPDIRTYVATKQASFPGGRGPDGRPRPAFAIQNHNRLLYNYDGTIGLKNGYTVKARQTFIGVVTRHGHTYIVTEMEGRNASWRPTAKLLDWTFAYAGRLAPVGRLVDPGTVSAENRRAVGERGANAVAAAPDRARPPSTLRVSTWLGVVGLVLAMGLAATYAVGRIVRRP